MATIGEVSVRIAADTAQFQAAMGRVQQSMAKIGNEANSLGSRMKAFGSVVGVAFAAVGGAIAVGLGFAVEKTEDFEAQMSRVGAIAGASGKDLKRLSDAALQFGANTSFSATEVAKAMEDLAAKGMKTNQIIDAMPGILNAAAASGEDLARVSDVVTSALNSFGLKAKDSSKVADILAQAANDSAASIDDLGFTFKYAAPLAKQLGISIEELSAATEIMANAGIKGETAGTTLRMALIRLASPPKAAKNALDQLGISINDSSGNMLPFSNIIGQLTTKLKGMSNAQKVAALSHIFGAEAVSGMLTVIDAGPAKLNKLTQSLKNSGGASAEAAKKMKDNLKGSIEQLSGSVETLQIKIGTALTPTIRKVTDKLTSLINLASKGFDSGGFAGALKAMIPAGMAQKFDDIAKFINNIKSMAEKGDWKGIGEKIGSSIAKAFADIADKLLSSISSSFSNIDWYSIGSTIGTTAIPMLLGFVEGLTSFDIVGLFTKHWLGILTSLLMVVTLPQAWAGKLVTLLGRIPFVGTMIARFTIWLNALGGPLRNRFFAVFAGVGRSITNGFKAAVKGEGIIATITRPFIQGGIAVRKWIDDMVVKANGKLTSWGAKLGNIMGTAWNYAKTKTNAGINYIYNSVSGFTSKIPALFSKSMSSMKSAISNGFNAAKSTVSSAASSIRSTLSGLASSAYSWGANLISMFGSGIRSKISGIVSAAKSAADKIKSYLGFSSPTKAGPGSNADHWAPNLMNMFMGGINAGIPKLRMAVSQAATVTSELQGSGSSGNTTSISPTINVYSQKAELKPRDLVRELDRVRWLGGGK
jgi:TP901 family phage tail tape measure protein